MKSYYGTATLPARVRAPKDKAAVAGTVGIISKSMLLQPAAHHLNKSKMLNEVLL